MTTSDMIKNNDGQVAVVMGATRNQGRAYAVMLARNGCRGVAVHYHGEASRGEAEETAAEIKHHGAEPLLFSADLTQVADVARLFDAVDKSFGQLDIVVNTVGKVVKKPFVEITEADFDQSFAINSKEKGSPTTAVSSTSARRCRRQRPGYTRSMRAPRRRSNTSRARLPRRSATGASPSTP